MPLIIHKNRSTLPPHDMPEPTDLIYIDNLMYVDDDSDEDTDDDSDEDTDDSSAEID